MKRNIFILLSAFALIAHVKALPTSPTTNKNQTQFEHETIDFIKQSVGEIIIGLTLEGQAAFTKASKELSTSENQTPALQRQLNHINEMLNDLEKYNLNGTHTIGQLFIEVATPFFQLIGRYHRKIKQKTAEEQLISDCVYKNGLEPVEKTMKTKYAEFQRQLSDRLKSHFDDLSAEEGAKESELFSLYEDIDNGKIVRFKELLLRVRIMTDFDLVSKA